MPGSIKHYSGRSLFKTFLFVNTVLMLIIALSAVFYVHYIQRSIARDLASDVILEVNRNIIAKTTDYLMPAVIVAETGKLLADSKAIDLNDFEQLEKYSESVLRPYPQFASFYYGDKHGNFVMTRQSSQEFSTKIINADRKETIFKEKKLTGALINKRIENKVDYDPRIRPWYEGAKLNGERFWTDIYIFFSDKKPGITASYPVYGANGRFQGVFGVDINLSKVSTFLNVGNIGEEGLVFIVNEKDKIIAFPQDKLDAKTQSDKILDLVSLNSSKIERAMSEYSGNQSDTFLFKEDGITYVGAISHFPETFDKEWRIVLIAPLDYFVKYNLNPIVVYVVLAALLLLTILFSKWSSSIIKTPLDRLLIIVKQFQAKDFKGRVAKTNISEIDELIENFNELGEALDQSKV